MARARITYRAWKKTAARGVRASLVLKAERKKLGLTRKEMDRAAHRAAELRKLAEAASETQRLAQKKETA